MVAPLEVAAHFSDRFWFTRFSFTFVVSGCLLSCITLASEVWNLFSFTENNLECFLYLVLNIACVIFCIQCQDIGFSVLTWQTSKEKGLLAFVSRESKCVKMAPPSDGLYRPKSKQETKTTE